jgi:hypothetical protein
MVLMPKEAVPRKYGEWVHVECMQAAGHFAARAICAAVRSPVLGCVCQIESMPCLLASG